MYWSIYSLPLYNIIGDLVDIPISVIGKATDSLISVIEAIQQNLRYVNGKFIPSEYAMDISIHNAIPDIRKIFQNIKEIIDLPKAKIASGETKANIIDFLSKKFRKLKAFVNAKIAAAQSIDKAALEKIQTAITRRISIVSLSIVLLIDIVYFVIKLLYFLFILYIHAWSLWSTLFLIVV